MWTQVECECCFYRDDFESTLLYKQTKINEPVSRLGTPHHGAGIHLTCKGTDVLTPLRLGHGGQGQSELSGFELFHFHHRYVKFLASRVLHSGVIVSYLGSSLCPSHCSVDSTLTGLFFTPSLPPGLGKAAFVPLLLFTVWILPIREAPFSPRPTQMTPVWIHIAPVLLWARGLPKNGLKPVLCRVCS